eukprot:Partr_v1_DN29015_c0_g1_i2_m58766 putative Solute carrier family 35
MPAANSQQRIRMLSLSTLVLQNSFLILLMRYSRTLPGTMYLASSAVLMSECVKVAVCLCMQFLVLRMPGVSLQTIFAGDAWKLSVPAILYTVQNNLQYMAVGLLDAATFQVTYQLKILTTAVFSVMMLGRSLNGVKWTSLVLLTLGVALVQLPSVSSPAKSSSSSSAGAFTGLLAVLASCCISGLAGVYFEKILKGSAAVKTSDDDVPTRTAPVSRPIGIWERNIQLSSFSVILAIVGIYMKDGERVHEHGLFDGFNGLTWLVIVTQAMGGLLVAMVVKYADNILKGFATSISIIVSSVVSVWLFDFAIEPTFMFGAMIVIAATCLYDSPIANKPRSDVGVWRNIMIFANSFIPASYNKPSASDGGEEESITLVQASSKRYSQV